MKVANAGKSDLIIAGQVRIPAGGEADVDPALLNRERKNNPAVKAWFDGGVLSFPGAPKKAQKDAD